TLWPLTVSEARLSGPPFSAPAGPWLSRTASLLRITLTGPADYATLALTGLRFFLKGQNQHVFPLYQLLFNQTLGVALAASPTDPEPLLLAPEALQPVGFGRDEGMLPYPPRSFVGYRLLTEFFAFPEKF